MIFNRRIKMSIFCRSRIQWFLTIAGLSGIASLFLSFVGGFMQSSTSGLFEGISPFEAVFESTVNEHNIIHLLDNIFFQLGSPFFLSVIISVFIIRWSLTGRLSLLEQVITYLIGLSMMAVVISTNFRLLFESKAMMIIIFSASSLIAGIFLVIRNHRLGKFKNLSPIILMQTAYFSNGIFCLIVFWTDWQIGAYFTLVTVIVYAAQMVWISCQRKETLAVKPQEL